MEQLKAAQRRIWGSGDYNRIAAITVPVSEALVARADVRPGDRVLDVATGTGHAALAAARRGAHTTGIDYVTELVDIARRRATAEVLDVDFVEGDAEDLAFADGSFDVVLSAIGVMFTADHARAASELVRVARPGGRIAVAQLDADGLHRPPAQDGRRARPAAGRGRSPRPGGVSRRPCETSSALTSSTSPPRGATVRQRFSSPESFADTFLTHYGPTYTAASRLTDAGRQGLRADMVALAADTNRAQDGSFDSDWEYLVVTATRR